MKKILITLIFLFVAYYARAQEIIFKAGLSKTQYGNIKKNYEVDGLILLLQKIKLDLNNKWLFIDDGTPYNISYSKISENKNGNWKIDVVLLYRNRPNHKYNGIFTLTKNGSNSNFVMWAEKMRVEYKLQIESYKP